jgi:hypothetical protein
MTLYSGGLRFAEAANLRIHDIDSARMLIRVACGKGKKERLVPLSPRLLKELRIYWKKYKPTGLLFPGKTPEKAYADTTIRKAMKDAAEKAGIHRRVYPHVLRHSYATGLLEAGVDLLTLQASSWVTPASSPRWFTCTAAGNISTALRVRWTGCRSNSCRRTRRRRRTRIRKVKRSPTDRRWSETLCRDPPRRWSHP